ncbi:MAG: MFS transporter, partial [Epsilonproteobacteria bacterium]
KSINPNFSESGIGLMYLGYIMGLLVYIFNQQLLKLFVHESTLVLSGS